jgi:hypothetical protein
VVLFLGKGNNKFSDIDKIMNKGIVPPFIARTENILHIFD